MKNFNKWLDTFIEEKGYDLEQVFEVNGPSGWNMIPLGCVVEAIKATTVSEQMGIKKMLVNLDFKNANCLNYFKHLAQAIAQ